MAARRPNYSRVMRVSALALLVSIPVVAMPACSRDRPGESATKSLAPTSQPDTRESVDRPKPDLMATILTDAAPDGWMLIGKVEPYTAKSLYVKINGLAELFLSYDVVGLTFACFARSAEAETVLDVHVYDMGTPTNAFGVFSVERSPDDQPVELGRVACTSDASYFIWKGRYYVKIIASDTTDEIGKAGMTMARTLAGSLTDSGERVWGRTAMPGANRVPRSLRYFQVDAMGLDFMRDTYMARYAMGGATVEAFLSRRDSPATAQETVARYVEHAKKYGKGTANLTVNGVELVRCDMGGAFDVVFRRGRLVAGVTSIADPTMAVQAATDFRNKLPGPGHP